MQNVSIANAHKDQSADKCSNQSADDCTYF